MAEKLLDVRNLRTHFFTRGGVVKAIEDVSFYLARGETLGIGRRERLRQKCHLALDHAPDRDPPGKIVGGEILFKGDDVLDMDQEATAQDRGGQIAMIFQDPMTSLNPVLTIGARSPRRQGAPELDDRAAMKRAAEMLDRVRIPRRGAG